MCERCMSEPASDSRPDIRLIAIDLDLDTAADTKRRPATASWAVPGASTT